MEIINLTPHSVVLLNATDAVVATFAPSGKVARCEVVSEPAGSLHLPPTNCAACGAAYKSAAPGYGCVCGNPECREYNFAADYVVVSVPVSRTRLTDLVGLPEPVYSESVTQRVDALLSGAARPVETYYIVSAIVASHPQAAGRTDLLVPAEQVRDSEGRVVGCRSFSRPA